MKVYYGTEQLPQFRNAVITIGTFDGVHTGHLVVLNSLKQKAGEINGETVLITFEPHPRFVISSEKKNISLLNTLEEKIENLNAEGIDHVVVINFTNEFASMDAEDYIEKFLVQNFHPHTIIIGYDHQFGKGRKGNFQLLEQYKNVYHYDIQEIPMQVLEQSKISSTQIRSALQSGDIAKANRYLGKRYSLQGIVNEGKKIGRTIGFPTANLSDIDPHKLVPAFGVYAVYVFVEGIRYQGMMSIGTNPTISNDNNAKLEVNMLDFDSDIYGKKIKVEFVQRIRDELKFENLTELKQAIEKDKEETIKIFSTL